MERTMHNSSAWVAKWGKSELMVWPHSPYCLNDQGLGSTPPTSSNCVALRSPGKGWPAHFFNSGLGSKVSICPGPPSMYKKITLRALAAWCLSPRPSEPVIPLMLRANVSSDSSVGRIAPANPAAPRASMSRRVMGPVRNFPQWVMALVPVQEGFGVEQDVSEVGRVEWLQNGLLFRCRWSTKTKLHHLAKTIIWI